MTMWKPGRRLFTVAAILMLLTAAAHTAGTLAGGPSNDAEKQLFASMEALRTPMGLGMNPSIADFYWCLAFVMSVTFTGLALLNLLFAASPDISSAWLRRASWINLLWVTAFGALSWRYQVPPPLICAVLIDVFVLGALFVPDARAQPGQ